LVSWSPTERMTELGDRVVNLRADEGVPLGLTGTVVGIHSWTAEVVFDRPFISGTDLGARCKGPCGKLIRLTSLLNVSRSGAAS